MCVDPLKRSIIFKIVFFSFHIRNDSFAFFSKILKSFSIAENLLFLVGKIDV